MMHNYCRQVVLSDSAHRAIVAEAYERVGTETGGILLGTRLGDVWYVVEAIDPGPNSIFQPSYFEYDTPYVNHLANKVSRFYKNGLSLLGLWHRHPGSFDSFSSTDDGTNSQYALRSEDGAISGIVNLDPHFRLTMYHVSMPLRYTKVSVEIGSQLIPRQVSALKSINDFLPLYEITKSSHSTSTNYDVTNWHNPVDSFVSSVGKLITSLMPMPETRILNSDSVGEPHSEQTSTPTQEAALAMLDEEMPYLEAQHNYEYQISMQGNEINILLTCVRSMPNYPSKITFIFKAQEPNYKHLIINGQEFEYRPDAIRQYIKAKVSRTL